MQFPHGNGAAAAWRRNDLKRAHATADTRIMQVALGNPVRLVALVGLVAVLGAGALVMRGLGSSEPEAAPLPERTLAASRPTPTAKVSRAQKARRSALAASGFPRSVVAALMRRPVAVVSVVAPGAPLDELAVREARAGAALAGAAFVTLNAYRSADVAALVEKVGLRRNPAVIVMRPPGAVAARLAGFADRDSVAQAATDARS